MKKLSCWWTWYGHLSGLCYKGRGQGDVEIVAKLSDVLSFQLRAIIHNNSMRDSEPADDVFL